MMPLSLIPNAAFDVPLTRSHPPRLTMRLWSDWDVFPSYRNGIDVAADELPTTHPDELTPRPCPVVVPTGSGTGSMPFASDQMNGSEPDPLFNELLPVINPLLLTPNGMALL